jgi:two-component system, sensor histidine kinase
METEMTSDAAVDRQTERRRLRALQNYHILDTDPEKGFDDLTRLAAEICDAPIAMVNIIDNQRQWSKSVFGISVYFTRESPRNQSVCQYTIYKPDYFEIQDLRSDPRFSEMPYVTGHPNYRYYLGVPLKDGEGYGIGALCVLDTKPRKMDVKRIGQLTILANEVMARLELHKSNYELKELNQHKVNLMKMLSHDMRSPINGIIGMSSVLREVLEDESHREMVTILEQSALQLNQMIDEIMSYSLIESKGFQLSVNRVDLSSIINNLENLYRPVAKAKGIELVMNNRVQKQVNIDKSKFEQIFGNLVSNAMKFTGSGGRVKAELNLLGSEESEQLQLTVTDTGIGMEPEKAESLLKNSAVYSRKGTSGEKSTGLGLSIIKYFVELHSGTIEVRSAPGKGTEFIITLPAG